MNRITATLLCLMLCLAGTSISTASAASRLTTSNGTALTCCLQQEYLMRDAYQNVLAKYPTLTAFGTVTTGDVTMITTAKKVFAQYRITVPADAEISGASTTAATATSMSNADAVAISLEQSTATLMTQLCRTTTNRDVANLVTLVKTTSLGSNTAAFTAEQASVATPAPTTPLALAPSPRPFPAPVTTSTATIPANIDATGSSDVSAVLNAFVASVSDGSIIAFPAGATYRLDKGIQIANRHNLVFTGNGCTIKVGANADGNDQLASSFVLGHQYGGYWAGGNTDIAIRDFVLVGNSPTPGVFAGGEQLASFEVENATRVEISGCHSSAYYGDFTKVGGGSTSVWVHDNTVPTVGRNGGTVISGRDVTFERNAFGVVGYCVFDIEPNDASEATYNAKFLSNTTVSWGNAFVSVEGSHTGATIDGVLVDSNTVSGSFIGTMVDNGGTARMKNITITNNKGGKAVAGPAFIFAHVDGLTVKSNVQPLLGSSTLTRTTDCTATTLTT